MLFATIAFTAFSLGLVGVLWWLWAQRQRVEEEMRAQETMAMLGDAAQGVAHDLGNLMMVIVSNLTLAETLPPTERREALEDVEQAARTATNLLSLMRGGAARREGAGAGSTEAVVRLAVALLRRKGANIRLRLEGDLSYSGPDVDAVRVVHNLLFNAVREIQRIGGGASVRIELRASGLSIANPVRDEARLSEKMYTRGASGEGSTGLGLAITRESAARVGWCVRHELREGHVWFFVEPDRQRTEQTPDRTAA